MGRNAVIRGVRRAAQCAFLAVLAAGCAPIADEDAQSQDAGRDAGVGLDAARDAMAVVGDATDGMSPDGDPGDGGGASDAGRDAAASNDGCVIPDPSACEHRTDEPGPCNDGNPCTIDRTVDGGCESITVPDFTICCGWGLMCVSGLCLDLCYSDENCTDLLVCNGTEICDCQTLQCRPGPRPPDGTECDVPAPGECQGGTCVAF
jgi:hypothetical protein